MTPTLLNKTVAGIGLVLAAIGAVDAGAGSSWELATMFILLAFLQALILWRLQSTRPAIPIRADLVSWLRERSTATGEPIEFIADRCIARTRADLSRR